MLNLANVYAEMKYNEEKNLKVSVQNLLLQMVPRKSPYSYETMGG